MLEVGVPVAIALFTGLGAITSRLHGRIHEIDKRIDNVELRVAEQYVSKADLKTMIARIETHMIKSEEKLDRMSTR